MNRICDFVIENAEKDEELSYSTMENGSEMDMTINDLTKELEEYMGDKISNIEKYYENESCQRKVIITFIYKNRKFEIYENYGTQRDYLCVKSEKI